MSVIDDLFHAFQSLNEVEAIALGGSRAGTHYDAASDYDVYIYCSEPIPEEKRRAFLPKYCSRIEIGNSYWELEDDGTLTDGTDIDILYRRLDDFAAGIEYVVGKCNAYNGYTTAMWHNLLTCNIIYDKNGRLTALKNQYTVPYPQKLKEAIIRRNRNLLAGTMPAYKAQIIKAAKRGDLVSINHRTAEFLASYFDIVFALNEMTHPGEKRMLAISSQRCAILPKDFEKNVNALLQNMFSCGADGSVK